MPKKDEFEETSNAVAWTKFYWDRQGLADGTTFELMASFLRAHEVMRTRLEKVLSEENLGLTRYLVLLTLLLSERGARRLSRLSTHIMVHPTTITMAIDELEKVGFVRRASHPTDRRVTLVVLTPEGVKATRRASKRLAADGFALPAFDEAQAEQLAASLTAIRSHLGDSVSDGPVDFATENAS